ncbi:hypothetical protein ACET3Z_007325 [Daucus carota]
MPSGSRSSKTRACCTMRPVEGNPLDLNNLPGEDFPGAAAGGKKKHGRESDEEGKVYECRFCSLKFSKSQALGGHMNRHRQERETETLNRARQLVFGNDNLIPPTPHHRLGSGQLPILSHGGYNHHHHQTSDPLRGAGYPPARYYGGSSSSTNIPPPESYMYPPSPRLAPPPINDYFVGHAVLPSAQIPCYNSNTAATRETALFGVHTLTHTQLPPSGLALIDASMHYTLGLMSYDPISSSTSLFSIATPCTVFVCIIVLAN